MKKLANKLPRSDKVLFVFYDFETTQGKKLANPPRNIYQIWSACNSSVRNVRMNINVDCARCGKRRPSFFDDAVGDLLTYLFKPRAWCDKVVAVAHNDRAFDTQFILNRAIFLNWRPQVIMNGLKVVCLSVQHLTFLDSAS
jgi:hypothetical protein